MALLVIMWRSSPFVLVFLVNDALVSLRRLQWWRHLLVLLALYMSHNKQARDCWCFVSTWYQEIVYCAFAHGHVNMWWTSPFVLVFDTDALSLRRLHWWRHLLVLLLTLYMLSHDKQSKRLLLGSQLPVIPSYLPCCLADVCAALVLIKWCSKTLWQRSCINLKSQYQNSVDVIFSPLPSNLSVCPYPALDGSVIFLSYQYIVQF